MKHSLLSLLVILLVSMLACAIPGLEAPAPGLVDSNTLSTIVVSTANAAASQTAAAQPSAAEIPSGTAVSKMTGTSIEQLQNGTTRYTDYEAGFEVTVPAGWLAVRPGSDEFNTTLEKEGAHNQALHDDMTADLGEYDANVDRLYSYVLRPDIGKNAVFGISKLVWEAENKTTLDDATMGEMTRGLESSDGIPGFRADTAQVRENGNAVKIIEIGGRFRLADGQGGTTPLHATIVFFKPTSRSLTRITFTMLLDYHDQISTDVRSMIESIKMVEQ